MALDKKQIALSVVGIVAGLALTYILWMRSQQANAATAASAAAQAAANAEEQEQESQSYDSAASGLSSAGSGGTIYEQSQPTTTGSTTSSDDSTSDISSLVSAILDDANGTSSSIPSNPLIPEIQVTDGTSSLSGIDTSAAAILGTAPPSTVTSTTSTGQGYGATTSNTAGQDSNNIAAPVTPISATAIFSTGGGNPKNATLLSSASVVQ